MRLVHEIRDLRAEPVVAARGAIVFAHALLYYRPLAIAGDEEAVVIDAEAILDRRRIDFRRHPAVIGESSAVDPGAISVVDELVWSATRDLSLAPSDKNANVIAAFGEAFFEGAADGGGDTA